MSLLRTHAVCAVQVGYKRMLYMSMHAESVLDLVEKPFRCVCGSLAMTNPFY